MRLWRLSPDSAPIRPNRLMHVAKLFGARALETGRRHGGEICSIETTGPVSERFDPTSAYF